MFHGADDSEYIPLLKKLVIIIIRVPINAHMCIFYAQTSFGIPVFYSPSVPGMWRDWLLSTDLCNNLEIHPSHLLTTISFLWKLCLHRKHYSTFFSLKWQNQNKPLPPDWQENCQEISGPKKRIFNPKWRDGQISSLGCLKSKKDSLFPGTGGPKDP